MASGLYDAGREGILDQSIDVLNDSIKWVLVDTGAYTVNLATHDNLDDIPSGARIATSPALAGKTATAGVFDATDPTVSSVSGATVEALVLFKDTGVAATSRLVAYVDSASAGLPLTPNGGDVNIQHDNGANKIFKL